MYETKQCVTFWNMISHTAMPLIKYGVNRQSDDTEDEDQLYLHGSEKHSDAYGIANCIFKSTFVTYLYNTSKCTTLVPLSLYPSVVSQYIDKITTSFPGFVS